MMGKIAVANAGMKLIKRIRYKFVNNTSTMVPRAVMIASIMIKIFLLYLSDNEPIIGLKKNPPIPRIPRAIAA
jgi:hypothetical protein